MSAAVDLQTAINRFAGVGGFASLSIDGQITPTLQADLIAALSWIHANLDGVSDTAAGLISSIQAGGLAQISTSAAGLAYFLNQNADMGGLPSAPISLASITGLPTMQAGAYAIGAIALIAGVGWLLGHKKKPRRKLGGTKSQHVMYDEAVRREAEINETFLEMLPTMRRHDLERLIKKRPHLWGRFAGYLTSGYAFVDDPQRR